MNILADIRTFRFWSHFFLHGFACAGILEGIIQFGMALFSNLTQSVQNHASTVSLAVLVICLIWGFVKAWPRPIEVEFDAPKTRIKIVKGSLLNERGNIVVGVCDTFDTARPNIIENGSLIGQTIEQLFNGDERLLDAKLSDALANKTIIETIVKPGKTSRYPIGTVAVVENSPRKIFFLAYCTMDLNNVASGTVDYVWNSLSLLWEAQRATGNNKPLSIPVFGGGLSRMSNFPAQDSIRLIALSYMFYSRHETVSEELRIVVRPQDYDRLDRLELQSFLSSLRPS